MQNIMPHTLDPPLGVAILLITFFAVDRFGKPAENRASTTALRYYSAALTYIGLYWLAFLVLNEYPAIVALLLENMGGADPQNLPAWLTQAPSILVVALLLSALLPKIPLIAGFDVKLRDFLNKMADIPMEADRLGKKIRKVPFALPENASLDVEGGSANPGFNPRDIAIQPDGTVRCVWSRISILILSLENWETDGKFSRFVQERQNQYGRIKERYRRLAQMARNCFDAERKEPGSMATASLRDSFDTEAEDLLTNICDFISQGVLKCKWTHGSRIAALTRMGFRMDRENNTDVVNPNRVIGFSGTLLLLLMCNFIRLSPQDKDMDKLLIMVTMIVAIYTCAVVCGTFPKERWAFFRRDPDGHPPVTGYFLSGLLAAFFAVVIGIAFKTLIYCKGDPTLMQAAQMAWENFTTKSYPYCLMAFSTAALIGYLIDLRLPRPWPPLLKRLATAAIQAAGTAATAALVSLWLQSVPAPSAQPPSLPVLVQTGAFIGFAIGFIVPTWYWRGAEKQPQTSRPMGGDPIPLLATGSGRGE